MYTLQDKESGGVGGSFNGMAIGGFLVDIGPNLGNIKENSPRHLQETAQRFNVYPPHVTHIVIESHRN